MGSSYVCGKILPHTQKSLFWTVMIKQASPFWFLLYLVLRRRRNSFWKYFVLVSQNCLCEVKFYLTLLFVLKRSEVTSQIPNQFPCLTIATLTPLRLCLEFSSVQFSMSNVKCQKSMSYVNKVNLLLERTSGVLPVIFCVEVQSIRKRSED